MSEFIEMLMSNNKNIFIDETLDGILRKIIKIEK